MKGIIIAGEEDEAVQAARVIQERVRVNETLARAEPDGKGKWLRERNDLIRSLDGGQARVLICEGGTCREEVDSLGDVEALKKAIGNIG